MDSLVRLVKMLTALLFLHRRDTSIDDSIRVLPIQAAEEIALSIYLTTVCVAVPHRP